MVADTVGTRLTTDIIGGESQPDASGFEEGADPFKPTIVFNPINSNFVLVVIRHGKDPLIGWLSTCAEGKAAATSDAMKTDGKETFMAVVNKEFPFGSQAQG